MIKPLPHQLLQDIECYTRMFRQYKWELAITTRIPPDVSADDAHEFFIAQILAPLSGHLSQKLAALSVVVPPTRTAEGKQSAFIHIHTLALSFEGNLADSNTEIQGFILDNQGACALLRNPDACIVKAITDRTYWLNATAYAAKNFASVPGATLNPYKKRLLAIGKVNYEN